MFYCFYTTQLLSLCIASELVGVAGQVIYGYYIKGKSFVVMMYEMVIKYNKDELYLLKSSIKEFNVSTINDKCSVRQTYLS